MKRLVASLTLLALVIALSPSPVGKVYAGPSQLALVTDWKTQACVVETQTIALYGSGHLNDPCPGPTVVNNPTDCPWDTDDAWSQDGSGQIATGTVVTATLCAVADGSIRAPVQAEVVAKHGLLVVRIDGSDGRSFAGLPMKVGSQYIYAACGDNFIPAPHAEIPDSNGGHGTLITYTLTIDGTVRGGNGINALFKYGQGIQHIAECD